MEVRGILLKVTSSPGYVAEVKVEDELEVWYDLLECETIDIVNRTIGDKVFTFVCDDEGIFRQPIPSAISGSEADDSQEIILMGNIFICKDRYDEDLEGVVLDSLSDDEILYILKNHIQILKSKDNNHTFACVNGVGFQRPVAVV